MAIRLLDCTLRDGGYYTNWCFSQSLVQQYLECISQCGVHEVEIGFRFTKTTGFKGPYAFSTDSLLDRLAIPDNLSIGVMLNGADLLTKDKTVNEMINALFRPAKRSCVSLVRIACHINEFEATLPAAQALYDLGYRVGFNLMQIDSHSYEDIQHVAVCAKAWPIEVFYIADSLGSLTPSRITEIIQLLKQAWGGQIGVHTHDNMGFAFANTIAAIEAGANWVDGTVTGMGRGPGNAKTEQLVLELTNTGSEHTHMQPLLALIRQHFAPLKAVHGWGTNPYYHLAAIKGIHPTYIQEMLTDSRYDEEDILAALDQLEELSGGSFNRDNLEMTRRLYAGAPEGSWNPHTMIAGREVLILGGGQSIEEHQHAIENYIQLYKPLVIALNTRAGISSELIDMRIASHPVRLMTDCEKHAKLPHPLIAPLSVLPMAIREVLESKEVLDFGLHVEHDQYEFNATSAVLPNALVMTYSLAVCCSGHASKVMLAGFDGFPNGDLRNREVDKTLVDYCNLPDTPPVYSLTPTIYSINCLSIYGLLR